MMLISKLSVWKFRLALLRRDETFFLTISQMSFRDSRVIEGDTTLGSYPINYKIPSLAFVAWQNQSLGDVVKQFFTIPLPFISISPKKLLYSLNYYFFF